MNSFCLIASIPNQMFSRVYALRKGRGVTLILCVPWKTSFFPVFKCVFTLTPAVENLYLASSGSQVADTSSHRFTVNRFCPG